MTGTTPGRLETNKKKMSSQKTANLRVCASCEWIFRLSDPFPKEKLEEGFTQGNCPQCGFASYGARYVYGEKAYRFALHQTPWLDKKMFDHKLKLLEKIAKENPIRKFKPKPLQLRFP
jgi:rubredoxin